MDRGVSQQKISAIVPCYNEAPRLGAVLGVLARHPSIYEVIVVDDGSTDNTFEIARRFHVTVLRNIENRGKGYSVARGIGRAAGDILLLCDADVVGLTATTVNRIVAPVARGSVDMHIGMRNRSLYIFQHIFKIVPLFGGERAFTRGLWNKLPDRYKVKFRLEAGLNFYAKYYGKGFSFTVFRHLSQTIKEKKYGWYHGLRQRIGMYIDVLVAEALLEFRELPRRVVKKRLAYAAVVVGMAVLGGAAMTAGK